MWVLLQRGRCSTWRERRSTSFHALRLLYRTGLNISIKVYEREPISSKKRVFASMTGADDSKVILKVAVLTRLIANRRHVWDICGREFRETYAFVRAPIYPRQKPVIEIPGRDKLRIVATRRQGNSGVEIASSAEIFGVVSASWDARDDRRW